MIPEVVLACLTLCLVEAGSSLKRRHLTNVLFGDSFRLAHDLHMSLAEGRRDSADHWTNEDSFPAMDQSAVSFHRSLTTSSRDSARDLLMPPATRANRGQVLRDIFRQLTQQIQQHPSQSVVTKRPIMTSRQMMTQKRMMTTMVPMEKRRRGRYRCDVSRVTLRMILSYFRTRTICGYRVTRMRFGLGRK
ncbi:hypothetical protein ACOMHN_001936 [Nucella lapillus]